MTDPILAARIYVVDDQEANLRLLGQFLRRAGFEDLSSFIDPRAALAAIEADEPDLLLLDLHMPELDGFGVLDALRDRLAEDDFLPILVLTGDVEREARSRALAGGATDFLTKPLDAEEVVLRARNLIRTRQLHQVVRARNVALTSEVTTAMQTLVEAAIRDRRQREALEASEHILAEAQRIAHVGSWERDIATGELRWSDESCRMFGVEPGTFAGTLEAYLAFVHPEDRGKAVPSPAALEQGLVTAIEYRIIRPDGAVRLVHEEAEVIRDAAGTPIRYVGTTQDITERVAAQEALVRSELRYAAIFEGAAESILIAEVATQRLRWVNPAACALLGYTRDELLELTIPGIHPRQDLPMILEQFQALADGRITTARSIPCQRKDGTTLLADIRGSVAVVDGVICNIGFFTDVTDLRRLEVQDRKLAQAIDQTGEAILITGPTGEIEYVNAAFEKLSGLPHDELVGGRTSLIGNPQSKATTEAMWRTVSAGESWNGDLVHRRPDGAERVVEASLSPVRDADDVARGFVAVERDVTDERALQRERERLAAAVEQTSDSVIIADRAGTIEYVNPAFERVSGYRRDEALGQNPRILKSGRQSAAFYRAMWRCVKGGQSWTGTLVNRRKDGSLYEEVATISPIRGPGDEITGYVAVKRDVTTLRAAESGLAREFRERAEVTAALARLRPGSSAEETAADICDELLGLPGIDLAAVVSFLDPRHAITLAVGGLDGPSSAPGRPVSAGRARYLHWRAGHGPWAEAFRPRTKDGAFAQEMAGIGIRATAYAPIRNGEALLGVVAAGTRDEAYVSHLLERLPAVGEFAAAASALLSGQLERGHRDELVRERVRRALAEGGLRPVFQPIVALASGEPVGYEALTRFADGTPPDRMIADAHSVGLGFELEVACLAAAFEASETLAPDCSLNLNASPDTILQSTELAALLAGRSRRIVLEVTEHAEIDDYPAVRRVIAGFGPTVSLAVDDAGAGFASLRHVVELAPRFLKLDISLVRHVDRDVTRQAMIAGLSQFAVRAGCEVIAEGIEDPAELEMLRELGVPFGQGYLLGRPAPLVPIAQSAPGSNSRPSTASG